MRFNKSSLYYFCPVLGIYKINVVFKEPVGQVQCSTYIFTFVRCITRVSSRTAFVFTQKKNYLRNGVVVLECSHVCFESIATCGNLCNTNDTTKQGKCHIGY